MKRNPRPLSVTILSFVPKRAAISMTGRRNLPDAVSDGYAWSAPS
jgi:hypothetical protein